MSTSVASTPMAKNNPPELPASARGLCWGGFFLGWIWSVFNRTWIGLLCIVPVIGIVMAFVLLIKGREWAWKNKKWESLEQFNKSQRAWSIAGLAIALLLFVLGIASIAIPNYTLYQMKAQQSEAKVHLAALFAGQKVWYVESGGYTDDLKNLNLDLSGLKRYRVGFASSGPEFAEHCADCVATKEGFKAVAVGNIGPDGRLDVWTINHERRLVNEVDGTSFSSTED